MSTFLLLTRLSPQSLHQPKSFETLEQHVTDALRAHTEVRPAMARPDFKALLRQLPAR